MSNDTKIVISKHNVYLYIYLPNVLLLVLDSSIYLITTILKGVSYSQTPDILTTNRNPGQGQQFGMAPVNPRSGITGQPYLPHVHTG